jgi:NAD(P)-dependent dehydrogenase (short-subunit alcohol dehydrogenase family)
VNANQFDLSGRVALVTGAGANGGLGHALALGLARYGADVIASDVDTPGAETTRDEILALGRKSIAIRCDVGSREEIEAMFAEADRVFGKLDILVNNAGILPSRVHPVELALEHWEKTLAVSLTGTFLCSQHAVKRMMKQENGGCILNVSSIAGLAALGRGNMPHSVAKSGVNQFTKELAVEYASHKIRVNAIAPAQILTKGFQKLLNDGRFSPALYERLLMGIPINRLLDPEDFVGPAVFLCSDAAAVVTGVVLPVDGGNMALNAGGSHTWPEA